MSAVRRAGDALLAALLPIALGMVAGGVLLALLGVDPLAFYADVFRRGLFSWGGLQDSLTRMAPLLLMAGGLVVAFRAGVWNVGADGQFLLAAAMVAGAGPTLAALPLGSGLVLLGLVGAATGGAWTLLPAYLKARHGMNEIITTLMMSFIGVNLANLLIKQVFRSTTTIVPQTGVVPRQDLLPHIVGTRIPVGLVVALVTIAAVWFVSTRMAVGLRLQVIGMSPRAADHVGIHRARLTVLAFVASGALIGLAAAVEVLGSWGYVRADWNPGFGLPLFALVFLARLNPLACIPLAGFYAVLSIGGHVAARRAALPDDITLVIIGLILLSMALTEYGARRLASRPRYLGGAPAAPAPGAERPASGPPTAGPPPAPHATGSPT